MNNLNTNYERKLYNVTEIVLCCYKNLDITADEPTIQYILDSTSGTLDFPHYNLSYNPFSIHEFGSLADVGNTKSKNELTVRRIFEVTRKFLLGVTDIKYHTMMYSGYKKHNDAVYVFIDVTCVNFKICKNVQFCSIDELTQYNDHISPNVTNFVLNYMPSLETI